MNAALNNLSVRTRMILSIVVLVVTLLAALYQAYAGINANIAFAEAELKGNQLIRPLARVLNDAADLRVLLSLARENRPVADPVRSMVAAIDEHMTAVKQAYDAVGVDLQFTDEGLGSRDRSGLAYDRVLARWADTKAKINADPQAAGDAGIAAFIADLRGMIGHAGDTSNLILDPDLDSYYLMDITLLVMPQTFDRLSKIGADVYSWDANMTQEHMLETTVYSRMLSESDIDRAAADNDTSLKEDANFNGKSETLEKNLVGPFNDYRDANRKLADLLLRAGKGQAVSRDDLMRVWQTAKESAYVYWDVGLNELDSLLNTRVEKYHQQQILVLGMSAAGLFISLAGFALVILSLTRPLSSLIDAMTRLSKNDMGVEIHYSRAKSEIGDMARAVKVFKENAIEAQFLRQEQERTEKDNIEQRSAMLGGLVDSFQSQVGGIVEEVARTSQAMTGTARTLGSLVIDTNTKASGVAAASEQASMNVQAVASAAEELSASIREISSQVAHSNGIARQAQDRAQASTRQVQSLVAAAEKIGVVVKLISDIAEQTNLLALNATIEAARAGDAGKGFAVVANEVKSLANQTANATGQIGREIAAIQDATQAAAAAIHEISGTIEQMTGITASVAAAVEEQGAATAEIARNVQEASAGTSEVASSIGSVTQSAQRTGVASTEVLQASQTMSRQSQDLKEAVERFIDSVRAQA